MPRGAVRAREVEPLEAWSEEDSAATLLGRSSFVYVVFITFTVGLMSNASGPGWILMMLMSLLLLVGCLRLAAQEAQQDSVLHDPHVALAALGGTRGSAGGAGGSIARGEGRAGASGAASGPLALLRSGRVVVLPPRQFGRHHQVPTREEDLEEGLLPAGHVRLLLAQLSQQLSSLRSRVQANTPMSPAGGATGGGGVLGPVPVSEEDLLSLPTRVFTKPQAPLGDGKQLSSSVGGSSAGALPHHPLASALGGKAQHQDPVATSEASSAGGVQQQPQQGQQGQQGGSAGGVSSTSSSGFVCSICLEEAEDGQVLLTLPCLHQFHDGCVKPWIARQGRHVACPMCKTPVFV